MTDTGRRPLWIRLLRRAEVDRSVAFVLLTRAWQFVAGPVTLILIGRFFTAEVQGYHYTFASLLALQSFVELGLYVVVLNTASHEWSRLALDASGDLVGDADARARLLSLGRLVVKYYSAAALLFVIGLSLFGMAFFRQSAASVAADWQGPWIALVAANALLLIALPLVSFLEGCNQVLAVNRFRLVQAMISTLAFWVAIVSGGSLWSGAAAALASFVSALWLLGRYRRLFSAMWRPVNGTPISWREEIWPMQWRVAIQAAVTYFLTSLFSPVMFHYHGASPAGQMGMTLQIVTVIQMAAFAWVSTKAPRFGLLVAQRDFAELDRLWKKVTIVSSTVLLSGYAAVLLAIRILHHVGHPFASRLLDLDAASLLMLGWFILHFLQAVSVYLRAHKREPFAIAGVVSSLSVGALVWWWGSRHGPTGAALGFATVMVLFSLPVGALIWWRSRREWHASPSI